MKDDDLIFISILDKTEAEEYIEENLTSEQDPPIFLDSDQWEKIVDKMNQDENVWEEIMSAWRYHIEKVFAVSKEGESK